MTRELSLTDVSPGAPASAAPAGPGEREVTLDVHGMTCASCVARVRGALTGLDGVRAGVNLAVEQAHVVAPASVSDADLVAAVESTGYRARVSTPPGTAAQDDEMADMPGERALRPRLIVSTALTVPVAALSMFPPLQFDGWQWVTLLLATPVVTWAAWPFHRAAAINARHLASTMDTLVSIGIIASYLWSLLSFAGPSGSEETYFEVATVVSTFLLAGRYLEARARNSSGSALRALLDLGAKDVTLLEGADQRRVPLEDLRAGMLFVVGPGEKVATDGDVLDGSSEVDESMLTGEPMPRDVGVGDPVTGGCINGGGRLVVRATRVGTGTRLAQIGRLVSAAQSGQAPVQRLADRVSAVFVPVVLVLAGLTLAAWLLATGDPSRAFTAAVAVLIIACPCALGLATPTALLVGTGRGAQRGILIRGPQVLEDARTIDTIVLDKTGTVTQGRMSVTSVVVLPGRPAAGLLRLAGAVESASGHPVARAVTARAAEDAGLPAVSESRQERGLGIEGVVEGQRVRVGRPTWTAAPLPEVLAAAVEELEAAGRTAVLVSVDGSADAVIGVSDQVKPEAAEAVSRLKQLGLRPILLTGDNERAARAVADAVGIDEVIAGVMPEGKVDVVARLQGEGHRVAMVGDGVNDAAALATARLGIAMGTGTDAAIEASDVTLVRGDLRTVPEAVLLSRATLRVIKQNLGWAFGYNLAALPLAASGLLNPMIAGGAMALSSVAVVTNSLRLRHQLPR